MLYHEVSGPRDGIPLLLCNGLFASLEAWQQAMPFLQGFRVLRYDARGQGKSLERAAALRPLEDPSCYRIEDHLTDLVALLDHLKWPRTFVVGISNGGTLALALAQQHAERVHAVIAADCHHRCDALMNLKLNSWLQAAAISGRLRYDIASPWIWSAAFAANHGDVLDHYRERAEAYPQEVAIALIRGAMQADVDLRVIQCAVHLLVGDEDLLTPATLMKTMRAELPFASLTTITGGHASLYEHPQHIADVVVPLIKEWSHVG